MSEWLSDVAFKFQIAFIDGDRWKLYLSGLGDDEAVHAKKRKAFRAFGHCADLY